LRERRPRARVLARVLVAVAQPQEGADARIEPLALGELGARLREPVTFDELTPSIEQDLGGGPVVARRLRARDARCECAARRDESDEGRSRRAPARHWRSPKSDRRCSEGVRTGRPDAAGFACTRIAAAAGSDAGGDRVDDDPGEPSTAMFSAAGATVDAATRPATMTGAWAASCELVPTMSGSRRRDARAASAITQAMPDAQAMRPLRRAWMRPSARAVSIVAARSPVVIARARAIEAAINEGRISIVPGIGVGGRMTSPAPRITSLIRL